MQLSLDVLAALLAASSEHVAAEWGARRIDELTMLARAGVKTVVHRKVPPQRLVRYPLNVYHREIPDVSHLRLVEVHVVQDAEGVVYHIFGETHGQG